MILFAIGGTSGGSKAYTARMELYDARARRWKKVRQTAPTGPIADHASAVLGHSIYILGGFSGLDVLRSCRRYDAVAKYWREVAPLNEVRCHLSAAVVGGALYALGGLDEVDHSLSTVERYRRDTDQWAYVAPMNVPRAWANKIYIAGGDDWEESGPMSSVEMYDPETDLWTNLAPMSVPRSQHCCVAYHDKVYAIGGWNDVSYMRSAEVYEPSRDSWCAVPDMHNSRADFGIAVIDDMIFAIGGYDGVIHLYEVECYDERTNQWYDTEPLELPRSGLTASVVTGLPNVADYIQRVPRAPRGGEAPEDAAPGGRRPADAVQDAAV